MRLAVAGLRYPPRFFLFWASNPPVLDQFLLDDSIQAKPLPIASAIIGMRLTRLVRTIGIIEFSAQVGGLTAWKTQSFRSLKYFTTGKREFSRPKFIVGFAISSIHSRGIPHRARSYRNSINLSFGRMNQSRIRARPQPSKRPVSCATSGMGKYFSCPLLLHCSDYLILQFQRPRYLLVGKRL